MRVIVIGGGITGLAAAYELAVRNVPFVLLETSERLGGLIFTEKINGFTIDAGADSMLVQKPAAIALCNELGLAGELMPSTPPRTAFVHARGHLFPLPSPSIFGIPTDAAALADYARLLGTAPDAIQPIPDNTDGMNEDESVASYYRRRFGAATVDLIAQPLLGGIHAGDVESLSIKSVAPRLLDADRKGLSTAARPAASGDGLFRALAGGMGDLVAAIERRLPQHSVRLGAPATALVRHDSAWRVTTPSDAFDASAVIIAAPAHSAAQLLTRIDADAARVCGEIPYASTVSVAFAWPRAAIAHPLEGSGFVVARRQSLLTITACTWVSSKWQHRAPKGMVLIRAFLGGINEPHLVNASDDDLIAIASRDVTSVLGISGAPVLTRVVRWIRAGAQHNVGHAAKVARLESRIAGLPGLFLAGSGYRSIGVPDCIADGRAAGAAAAHYVKMQS
jgi:oxygen-dependent protoporphyrinogen oxidase